jgi:hypothetical protein
MLLVKFEIWVRRKGWSWALDGLYQPYWVPTGLRGVPTPRIHNLVLATEKMASKPRPVWLSSLDMINPGCHELSSWHTCTSGEI